MYCILVTTNVATRVKYGKGKTMRKKYYAVFQEHPIKDKSQQELYDAEWAEDIQSEINVNPICDGYNDGTLHYKKFYKSYNEAKKSNVENEQTSSDAHVFGYVYVVTVLAEPSNFVKKLDLNFEEYLNLATGENEIKVISVVRTVEQRVSTLHTFALRDFPMKEIPLNFGNDNLHLEDEDLQDEKLELLNELKLLEDPLNPVMQTDNTRSARSRMSSDTISESEREISNSDYGDYGPRLEEALMIRQQWMSERGDSSPAQFSQPRSSASGLSLKHPTASGEDEESVNGNPRLIGSTTVIAPQRQQPANFSTATGNSHFRINFIKSFVEFFTSNSSSISSVSDDEGSNPFSMGRSK